jgi:ring-1,2-phenylacetyl-CoA epoxidase subunit PaaA
MPEVAATDPRVIKWGKYQGSRKFETPDELPPEYRKLLLKFLFVQADSEFSSVQLHKPWLDTAPTPELRWIEAKIIADEARHGLEFSRLLREFGDEGQAQVDRLMGLKIGEHKLEVFNITFDRWSDVVGHTCFIDRVGHHQFQNFEDCSYAPLARLMPTVLREENLHVGYGYNNLKRLAREDREEAARTVYKWYPRALDTFGRRDSETSEVAFQLGIKRWRNEEARQRYIQEVSHLLQEIDLQVPPEGHDRRIL